MEQSFVGYYRVSTQRQGQSGLGLEAQQEAVRKYAESAGGVLIGEYIEVESGKLSSRPILAEALAACRKNKATLAIARLDRLARNVSFVSRLLDSKAEFIACDMPHATRMMIQILSVFAEHEARLISERTKAALAAAKERGVMLGANGRVLADQQKADAAAFAETMRLPIKRVLQSGNLTLREIATELNEAGYRTREGANWAATTLHRVIKRLGLGSEGRIAAINESSGVAFATAFTSLG